MRPVKITARGYRSFADLDYAFVDGATAVVGANGAGKSTLIGAVEVALFGPRSRSLEPLVREGDNEMQLTLEFRHGPYRYRVRRGWKGGKSTLDFEVDSDVQAPLWMPLTQGNAADTQALIEQRIGISRSTFLASGYLAQRQSDSFTGAQPKDRKRILSDALALDQWQADAERVGADRRAAEKKVAEINGRVESLAERAADLDSLTNQAGEFRLLVDVHAVAEKDARTAAESEATLVALTEQANNERKIAQSAVDIAATLEGAHRQKLERTAAAKANRAIYMASLAEDAPDIEQLEVAEARLVSLAEAHKLAAEKNVAETLRREDLFERSRIVLAEARESDAKAEQTLALIGGSQHCETCGQTMGEEAAQVAAETYIAKSHNLLAQYEELVSRARSISVPDVPEPVDPAALEATRVQLRHARAVAETQAAARVMIASLDATIAETDSDDYRDIARRLAYDLAEAEATLAVIPPATPGAAERARAAAAKARTEADQHAASGRLASERLAATTALLEQARTALVEHAAAVAERDRLHAELDILAKLEQAFGRDGIPAWIVESQALPQIETEANRILSRLGGAISRVELRTERETKAGDKRDALDIVCLTQDGERALETFSGGEQSRAEIALALGLVDVLQSRRDADLRYLALDEPSGLDAQGTEALAEVLRDRAAGTVVLLASHDANLRDQFDQSVAVERGPNGSVVTNA